MRVTGKSFIIVFTVQAQVQVLGVFFLKDPWINLCVQLPIFGGILYLLNRAIKQTEKDREAQRTQLISNSKMTALGEMAGGIAHEINNPLAIIRVKSQLLLKRLKDNSIDIPTVITNLEVIDRTADRINRIIRGLKSFSRDESTDPFELHTVKSIIDHTLSFCKSRFWNGGVDVRVSTFDPELSVDCRPAQLEQVILNLMNNAYDAIERLPSPWVNIDVVERGRFVEIIITDSGNGIPLDIRKKILQPFFTTKPVGKGTGLGLSVSRGLVQSHGGSLELDENYPHTRFVVRIPKRQDPLKKVA